MNCCSQRLIAVRVFVASFFTWAFLVPCLCLEAQTCREPTLGMEVALSEAYRNPNVCDSPESVELIYKVAAVAGQAAVPSLRRLIDDKACNGAFTHDAVVTALAKLGDDTALQRIAKMLGHDYPQAINSLVRVGDDRGIAVMMTYFEKHRSEPLWVDAGDVRVESALMLITEGIGGGPFGGVINVGSPILERRLLPDLPTMSYQSVANDTEFKKTWIDWWDKHKGTPLSVAPYETVSDPYLQCLAREVDWDMPAAILEISDHGGPDGEAVLRKFPRPVQLMSFGTLQGNLSAALAKLGDQREFERIVARGATNVARTLEYIGGRKAVDDLIGALLTPPEHASLKTAAIAKCIQKYYPNVERIHGERACEKSMTSDRELQAQQSDLLKRLSRMVKNPPLQMGAPYTTENIEKWRDWWAANKDTAEFVSIPFSQLD